MIPLFEVIKAGVFVSVQDLGRKKYRHIGVPVSGAMDQLSYQIGNIVLGNKRDAASVEVSIGGTILKAMNDFSIIITGANLLPKVNGTFVAMNKVIKLQKGDVLSFNGPKNGVYAYIAVVNGVKSQLDFESQSTYKRASLGIDLIKGTIIFGNGIGKCHMLGLNEDIMHSNQIDIYYIPSSHYNRLINQLNDFDFDYFTIGASNRMGMYLHSEEKPIRTIDTNILSEGTTFGTIQILPTGQPIILLADSQTTGGYATLGTVIHSSLWQLVQKSEGQQIKLVPIEIEAARIENLKYERFLQSLVRESNDLIRGKMNERNDYKFI